MDQTRVYFKMNAKRMLEVVGVKTIHIWMLMNDMKGVVMITGGD